MTDEDRNGSSLQRMLSVLDLFGPDVPMLTVAEAAEHLRVSTSTAYRYFSTLCNAGLLDPTSNSGYVLGPAIIAFYRMIRINDPLLSAARPVMRDLLRYAPSDARAFLCRLYHERVMCVHQEDGEIGQDPISYEIGYPMPMFRGSAGKIILPYLPSRTVRSLFNGYRDEITAAGLGADWESFKQSLRHIRSDGFSMTVAEIDTGRIGISAAVMGPESVYGSLTVVAPQASLDERTSLRLQHLVIAAAQELEATLASAPSAAKEDAPAFPPV